jgi:hypothetical protein
MEAGVFDHLSSLDEVIALLDEGADRKLRTLRRDLLAPALLA